MAEPLMLYASSVSTEETHTSGSLARMCILPNYLLKAVQPSRKMNSKLMRTDVFELSTRGHTYIY